MKRTAIIIIIFSLLLSCKSKQDKLFDQIYSQKLKYSKEFRNLNDNIDSNRNYFSSKVKIISIVDLGCGKCCVNLKKLGEWVDSLENPEISLIAYNYDMYPSSSIINFELIEKDFKYPIYADSLKTLLTQNKLPEYNIMYHTFLIDSNDSIRVIGSPVLNEQISELYKKEIHKILNEK